MLLASSPKKYASPEEALADIITAPLVACDSEWDGATPVVLSIAISPNTSFAFSMDDERLPKAKQLLATIPSIWHNVLYDILQFKRIGWKINWKDDTMLMAQACGYPAALGDLAIPIDFPHVPIYSLLMGANGKRMTEDNTDSSTMNPGLK